MAVCPREQIIPQIYSRPRVANFPQLTGKLGLSVRENNMKTFSDKNSEVRILIASLKAGGIGLDLSAANKCILVDLWWNEAIQEQVCILLSSHIA